MSKKILITAMVLFVALIGLLFFYRLEKRRDAGGKRPVVGLILTGARDGGGWNESHYMALRSLADEMGFELICVENVSEYDDSVLPVIDQLAKNGARVICLAGLNYGKSAVKVLDRYSDIFFLNASGLERGRNLVSFFGKMYQARYLSGIVAGMETKSGNVGYVGAMRVDEVVRGMNAFALGVRSVNPGATVHVAFSGLWSDPDAEIRCANLLMDTYGADVLTYHQNTKTVALEADKNGVFSITYHTANNGGLSERCLTGAIWNWVPFYRERIEDGLYRRSQQRIYWLGLAEGIVDLAPFSPLVKPETAAKVAEARARIVGGEWDVFYGPIRDNTGELRIEEGSSMSDDRMIFNFNWFVEGVEIAPSPN